VSKQWLVLSFPFVNLRQGGQLFDWSLSAVPVVDSKGELKGTLSGSDIRGVTADNLNDLVLSVNCAMFHGLFYEIVVDVCEGATFPEKISAWKWDESS